MLSWNVAVFLIVKSPPVESTVEKEREGLGDSSPNMFVVVSFVITKVCVRTKRFTERRDTR
jgi:hypothetical protein